MSNDGWSPVQVSSYTPWWPRRHGWNSNQLDTYNPYPYLRNDPVAVWRLRHPQDRNFIIPVSTHPSEPNPYFERKVEAAYYSREERYRMGQDINWVTLGTKGG